MPRPNFYNDAHITFEEYHYWANSTRELENSTPTERGWLSGLLKRKDKKSNEQPSSVPSEGANEKSSEKPPDAVPDGASAITDAEWNNARGAMRTATWGSIFYLITTDILGPYNVPWAISRMGYGPGFALYTVFGGLALYSSLQLWQMFIGLDSTRYPLRNYGDLAFRIYGNWARYLFNILQMFQFFLMVALITESNGQGLAQMAAGKSGAGVLCFVAAEGITAIIGLLLGQIRTLQRLGWLANVAVWLNVVVMIMTMIVVHKYPPNYEAAEIANNVKEGPIVTSANWPEGLGLSDYMGGVMNCVYAYGGAVLFNELMAEMRKPMDFWKSLICAEAFIYAVYITMGMVVYSAQGQFTYPLAYQGIPSSAYSWQTFGNAVSYVSALIAMALYGNIGIKVIYASVLQDILNFPPLDKKMGKILWVIIVPIYWGLAFVVAAAVPQIANLVALVGALCIMQFQYTFPPLLKVAYNVQKDAMLPEETFDPATGELQRADFGVKRWTRGYMKKPIWNTFDVLFGLAALATAGLGIWAAAINMKVQFQTSGITPFTCQNPAG
ncbi:uncharacterized protein CC84DRAFT_1255453 [Paraphaeosphaeria sporulosa]|uniref:Amino acid transporter transmembrane domain-containing protein n=1 Tax=Paraphaeosphaeria sporulosa TaxID=1460663 RepID=A0A177CR76_9PLEO|nr:uncharacterized protein CC84DRAFT_1255453 [Paraphaeosphaeria sporulosa]OAG09390.1 hypothetical protein CC84DRAFT_1255453 [Paraphaeosphaeria sporulosa]